MRAGHMLETIDIPGNAGCDVFASAPMEHSVQNFNTRGQMAVFLAKALGLHWTP